MSMRFYHEPVPLKKRDRDVTNVEKQGRKQHRAEESVLNSGLRRIWFLTGKGDFGHNVLI